LTAVGGTQFFTSPESAWNASSGGFSNYFKTAWYQQDAVATYLDNYISSEAKAYYSSNNYTDFGGRGFPDISAHSLYPEYVPENIRSPSHHSSLTHLLSQLPYRN